MRKGTVLMIVSFALMGCGGGSNSESPSNLSKVENTLSAPSNSLKWSESNWNDSNWE